MLRKNSFERRNHSRLHLNKKRLRYVFTVQDVHLSCGSAVLMAASATSQPSVSTPHTSGTPHLASPRLTSPHRASPRKHHLASPRSSGAKLAARSAKLAARRSR
tara:strand:- start:495 stop:806 length:312 start_codon:yes stop_codon:yes gene_type:complete